MAIKSGYGNGTLPFWAVFDLYVIFICTSIPGLAISPIMGDLTRIFPGTSQLESQLIEIGPNIACIPFLFVGGWLGAKFNNNALTTWTCLFYGICGAAFFIAPSMIWLIILSFLMGIMAGILSPLASAFIADLFNGKRRSAQYGYTSATLNLVFVVTTIATGYLAKVNWRLPFMIYLLPFIPLFFAKGFKRFLPDPKKIREEQAKEAGEKKVHYKFSKQVNIPMLVRYCVYYFVITFVIAAIGLYLPFRYKNSGTAGDLTSLMYFGIMASGYTLNWCARILKYRVALWGIIAIFIGFLIMSITTEVVLVGFGILLATYFYGIGQPFYYDRLSVVSSRIALTLTMAIFASMDSIANVVAAPIIDIIAKIFGTSTSTHPNDAFWICTWLLLAGAAIVIVRKIFVAAKADRERKDDELAPTMPDAARPEHHLAALAVSASGNTATAAAPAETTAAAPAETTAAAPAETTAAAPAETTAAPATAEKAQPEATEAPAAPKPKLTLEKAEADVAAAEAELKEASDELMRDAKEAAVNAQEAAQAAKQAADAAKRAADAADAASDEIESK